MNTQGVKHPEKTCRWRVHCQTIQLSDTFRFSYQIISGLSTTTGPNQIWCPEAFVVGKKQWRRAFVGQRQYVRSDGRLKRSWILRPTVSSTLGGNSRSQPHNVVLLAALVSCFPYEVKISNCLIEISLYYNPRCEKKLIIYKRCPEIKQ